jgi:hypothetical protein
MTTASQLIAYLQTLPPETIVEVLEEHTRGYESYVEFTDLNLETGDYHDFIDFRNVAWVPTDNPNYGKCFLQLGCK